MFVDQNNRNLGVGTELAQFILERSRRLGLDWTWFTVNLWNSIAVRLYKKFGHADT